MSPLPAPVELEQEAPRGKRTLRIGGALMRSWINGDRAGGAPWRGDLPADFRFEGILDGVQGLMKRVFEDATDITVVLSSAEWADDPDTTPDEEPS
jgi:hypothetical protein